MRHKTIVVPLILSTILVLYAFTGTKLITLPDAIKEQKISVEILSLGGHEGDCISLEVTNLSRKPFKMQVVRGTLFTPANAGDQNIVVAVSQVLSLNGAATQQFDVEGYCIEADDRCPRNGSSFTMSRIENVKLDSLLRYISSKPKLFHNQDLMQAAIWTVTDGNSVSSVYDPHNDVAVQDLRSFICDLTKQEDVWYNTKRETFVNAQRIIVSAPIEVTGNIALNSPTPVTMCGVVIKENGDEMWAFPNSIPLPQGKVKFKFKLEVDNWAQGNYFIVYTSKTDTLLKQGFSI